MAWSDLSVVALGQVNWTATKTLDLSSVVDSDSKQIRESLDFGTGAGKANQVWHDRRTLAASASEDLDLAGGLTNSVGETVTFTKIKAVLIHNRSDEDIETPSHSQTDAEIQVGPDATNGFTGPFADASDRLVLAAGASVLLVHPGDGWTVTADTGDLLEVTNNDDSDEAAYDIVIVGESS